MTREEWDKAVDEMEPLALRTLQNEMRAGGSNGLKAAELLLAYAKGKPTQTVENNVNNTLTVEHRVLPATHAWIEGLIGSREKASFTDIGEDGSVLPSSLSAQSH